jgi:hypothetical protein
MKMRERGLPEENAENRARDGNLAQGTLNGIKPESRRRIELSHIWLFLYFSA